LSNVIYETWSISINGRVLDDIRKSSVTSIEVLSQSDGSDVLTCTIKDPDMVFIEDDIFIDNVKITCDIYFNGDVTPISFSGYISALDIKFPEDGVVDIVMTCLDEGHVMNRTKKKRTWSGKTRPEVAKAIATEYGFNFVCESGYTFEKQDTISQSDKTDLEFIEGLAGEETQKFYCKLVGKTVYYKKLGLLKNPVAELHYKEYPYDVLSFSPQITTETLKDSVTESNITAATKETDTGTADNSTERDVQGESASDPEEFYQYDTKKQSWVETYE
jgi:hypothetical protein